MLLSNCILDDLLFDVYKFFSVCRSMHHVGSGISSRSENGIRSPGNVVMGGYQP